MPLVQSSNQDGLGSSIIAGEGVAGTPTGGVVSIQQTFGPPTNLDKAGTGSISALNGTVVATTNGASTAYFNITGTWVATLLFEGQDGNGLWMDCLGTVPGNGSATGSTGTNLALDIPCGGFNQVRVRASAYTSGTATVNYNVGTGVSSVQVFNLTPSALQATITGSGTAGTPATGVISVQGVASGTPQPIVGAGADGSAVVGNPVRIGGKDGSGNTQDALTDLLGNLFASSKIPLTASAPTFATIGVTSGTVIVANVSRKGLVLQNTSSLATISLHLNNGSAVLNSGITLYPHDIWYMDEFSFTTAQINAISSLASTNLSIQELA